MIIILLVDKPLMEWLDEYTDGINAPSTAKAQINE